MASMPEKIRYTVPRPARSRSMAKFHETKHAAHRLLARHLIAANLCCSAQRILTGYSAARSELISIGTTIGQASAYTACWPM
jgi:hypothetical protein